jgi:hypothetical protein
MFIRRTSIKSRRTGQPYYTYRLVESLRTADGVRQRTLANLGRHFEVPRQQWAALAQRIEQIVSGQSELVAVELDPQWEESAQRFSALVVHTKARINPDDAVESADFHSVDVNSVQMLRPRSVAIEHVAVETVRALGLDAKLVELGFNQRQLASAIGQLVARMAAPGSELYTHAWLQHHSAVGELIEHDFANTGLMQLYRIADKLYTHKATLEAFLYRRARDLFEFEEVITLYDLTNTYFEGTGAGNANAAYRRSKEKHSDCPLVTLALVLDASGFPKRSEIFPGNVSEPKTLAKMLAKLAPEHAVPEPADPEQIAPEQMDFIPSAKTPTVVLDTGIATEQNIAWLVEHHYAYVVVSRKRQRQFDAEQAVLVKDDGDSTVKAQRIVNDNGEVELYCHSSAREHKEQGIHELSAKRFEAALEKLAAGLHTPRTVKQYPKVLQRLGRLKQKYARVLFPTLFRGT